MSLTIKEQRELLELLRDAEGPESGVREPRRPFRPSSSGAVALEEPETEEWIMPTEQPYVD